MKKKKVMFLLLAMMMLAASIMAPAFGSEVKEPPSPLEVAEHKLINASIDDARNAINEVTDSAKQECLRMLLSAREKDSQGSFSEMISILESAQAKAKSTGIPGAWARLALKLAKNRFSTDDKANAEALVASLEPEVALLSPREMIDLSLLQKQLMRLHQAKETLKTAAPVLENASQRGSWAVFTWDLTFYKMKGDAGRANLTDIAASAKADTKAELVRIYARNLKEATVFANPVELTAYFSVIKELASTLGEQIDFAGVDEVVAAHQMLDSSNTAGAISIYRRFTNNEWLFDSVIRQARYRAYHDQPKITAEVLQFAKQDMAQAVNPFKFHSRLAELFGKIGDQASAREEIIAAASAAENQNDWKQLQHPLLQAIYDADYASAISTLNMVEAFAGCAAAQQTVDVNRLAVFFRHNKFKEGEELLTKNISAAGIWPLYTWKLAYEHKRSSDAAKSLQNVRSFLDENQEKKLVEHIVNQLTSSFREDKIRRCIAIYDIIEEKASAYPELAAKADFIKQLVKANRLAYERKTVDSISAFKGAESMAKNALQVKSLYKSVVGQASERANVSDWDVVYGLIDYMKTDFDDAISEFEKARDAAYIRMMAGGRQFAKAQAEVARAAELAQTDADWLSLQAALDRTTSKDKFFDRAWNALEEVNKNANTPIAKRVVDTSKISLLLVNNKPAEARAILDAYTAAGEKDGRFIGLSYRLVACYLRTLNLQDACSAFMQAEKLTAGWKAEKRVTLYENTYYHWHGKNRIVGLPDVFRFAVDNSQDNTLLIAPCLKAYALHGRGIDGLEMLNGLNLDGHERLYFARCCYEVGDAKTARKSLASISAEELQADAALAQSVVGFWNN